MAGFRTGQQTIERKRDLPGKNIIHLTSTSSTASTVRKVGRLTKGSRILKVIVKAIHEKKGEKLVSLDLRKIPEAVADFFIVCEAGSSTQVKAIAEHVREEVSRECGERAYHDEGYGASNWVIIDFVNVVVHVFLPETRRFYRLEEMWSDAESEEFIDDGPVQPVKKPARGRKK
jgi:ribosome-associated protein